MKKFAFGFKIEDLSPFGDIVRVSYVRDRPKFILFSPLYDGDHLTNYDSVAKMVYDCINPKVLTKKMKTATENLHKEMDTTNSYLDTVQRYLEKSSGKIDTNVADFEISLIKTSCRTYHAEGAIKGLNGLKQMLTPYLTILAASGYTAAKFAELEAHTTAIKTLNTDQSTFLNQRMKQVQDNAGLLNGFWETINDILKTGKIIFEEDPAILKEYTQSYILDKVRKAQTDTTAAATTKTETTATPGTTTKS
jgi:hypothetical protein